MSTSDRVLVSLGAFIYVASIVGTVFAPDCQARLLLLFSGMGAGYFSAALLREDDR